MSTPCRLQLLEGVVLMLPQQQGYILCKISNLLQTVVAGLKVFWGIQKYMLPSNFAQSVDYGY